jgi:5'-nucleotidase
VVTPAGESAAGDLVADAQLAATRAPELGGAEVAVVQEAVLGGDLPSGDVTAEQTYRVQPLGHRLVTLTLTGRQLDSALEQQYCHRTSLTENHFVGLHVSEGFTYSWDPTLPCGKRVAMRRTLLGGRPITPRRRYRVTVNELLAAGGQGIEAFASGVQRVRGVPDVVALDAYLGSRPSVAVPVTDRVRLLGPPPATPAHRLPPGATPGDGVTADDLLPGAELDVTPWAPVP